MLGVNNQNSLICLSRPIEVAAARDEPQGRFGCGAVDLVRGELIFGSNIYVHVYYTNGNVVESFNVHTSCSQPLFLGQTFGAGDSYELVAFVSEGDDPPIPPLEGPVVLAGPTFDGNKVDFQLLNFGEDQVIDTIDVTWPVDPNKKLQKVKLDGTTLFDKKLNGPTQTVPNASGWKGNVGDRTVTDIGLLRFEFEKNAALTGYTITVNFVGGGIDRQFLRQSLAR